MITIKRYSPELKSLWDSFVRESRNATFLFLRDYMDYHSDRFLDSSWIAYKGEKIVAVLPANVSKDGVLHSHQGLTYGGWILPQRHIDGADVLEIFNASIARWKEESYVALDYKPLPYIYASRPSQEDEYALFRLRATRVECNLSTAIPLFRECAYNKLRRRALSKAASLQFTIKEFEDAAPLMKMVSECLHDRHNTSPVHTAEEMQLLKERFPREIRFWILEMEGVPHAAVCVYDTGIVAHAQYIATTPYGREHNLLTPLFHHLISKEYSDRSYFDFGTSNEARGTVLNEGLLRQKASFGATGVAYNRYNIAIL